MAPHPPRGGLWSWDIPVLLSQLLPALTQQPSPQRAEFRQCTLTSGMIPCTPCPKAYGELQSFVTSEFLLSFLPTHSAGGGFLQRAPACLGQSWCTSTLRQNSSKYFIIPHQQPEHRQGPPRGGEAPVTHPHVTPQPTPWHSGHPQQECQHAGSSHFWQGTSSAGSTRGKEQLIAAALALG